MGRDDRRQVSIFIPATQHPSSSDMSGRGALASRVRFNLQKSIVFPVCSFKEDSEKIPFYIPINVKIKQMLTTK